MLVVVVGEKKYIRECCWQCARALMDVAYNVFYFLINANHMCSVGAASFPCKKILFPL